MNDLLQHRGNFPLPGIVAFEVFVLDDEARKLIFPQHSTHRGIEKSESLCSSMAGINQVQVSWFYNLVSRSENRCVCHQCLAHRPLSVERKYRVVPVSRKGDGNHFHSIDSTTTRLFSHENLGVQTGPFYCLWIKPRENCDNV